MTWDVGSELCIANGEPGSDDARSGDDGLLRIDRGDELLSGGEGNVIAPNMAGNPGESGIGAGVLTFKEEFAISARCAGFVIFFTGDLGWLDVGENRLVNVGDDLS